MWLHVFGGLLFRWAVALGPYSGKSKAVLFGDYEAQRHWQEITVNLPTKEWYRNSTDNDLMYWGLDYPPLTAYHSWLCGKVARMVNSSWVELKTSRGIETENHKFFMRITVLLADLLIFIPAVVMFYKTMKPQKQDKVAVLLTFLFPGLILIDHGHFQYNNISLGFFVFAVACFAKDMPTIGSIFFCFALNYKQMELYHALPFFFYLLGLSFKNGFLKGTLNVLKLGIVVLITFAMCWLPFLNESGLDVLHRLFPVGRGLYEDKVANLWCTISPLLKLKEIFNHQKMVLLCACTTLIMSLPGCLYLLTKPSTLAFKYACVNVSLAFFLFSYQVHEKSILIPALSACLLFNESPFYTFLFVQLSTFSMFPLLVKDGLTMQYFAVKSIFSLVAIFYHQVLTLQKSDMKMFKYILCNTLSEKTMKRMAYWKMIYALLLMDGIAIASIFIEPPENLPDLWPVIIATLCCLGFIKFYIYFVIMQYFKCVNLPKLKSS